MKFYKDVIGGSGVGTPDVIIQRFRGWLSLEDATRHTTKERVDLDQCSMGWYSLQAWCAETSWKLEILVKPVTGK